MKTVASLLVWASLVLGAVAAVTDYMPPTSLPDSAFMTADDAGRPVPLATSAPAGAIIAPDGSRSPRFPAGTELTPDTLAAMRADSDNNGKPDVARVKVNQFSLQRWTHWPWFLAAVAGLTVGALAPRLLGRRQPEHAAASAARADEALAAIRAAVDQLRADCSAQPHTPDGDKRRAALIIDRVGELQQTHLTDIPAAREALVARLGLAGYAAFMDRFAQAERTLARAWSAASDGYAQGAQDYLDSAPDPLAEAAQRLTAGRAS